MTTKIRRVCFATVEATVDRITHTAKVILPADASVLEIDRAIDEAKHRAVMGAVKKCGYTGWDGYHVDNLRDTDGKPYVMYLARGAYKNPGVIELGPMCNFTEPSLTRLRDASPLAIAEYEEQQRWEDEERQREDEMLDEEE